MRGFSASCRLILLGAAVLGAAGTPPAQAMSALVDKAPDTETLSSQITPHRATYSMTLASVKNGGNITDVSGHMLFEWRDVCDGWAIQQHMQLHFTYAEGDDQDVTSTELTWESKDGKRYNFNLHRVSNGTETENYRGKATLNDDGSGTVVYSQPKPKTITLPAGTLFPSAHTELVLALAARGEKFFSRRVFDGSDDDSDSANSPDTGSSDISAFITSPKPEAQEATLSATLKQNALLTDPAWPVHMAFFKIGSETGEPDYEMDLDLLPNGVARHMKIDYGDFAVTGTLQTIEPLAAPDCQ